MAAATTRYTYHIANEFSTNLNWETLPEKLRKIQADTQRWNPDNIASFSFSSDEATAKQDAVTAAVLTQVPFESFYQHFESLFAVLLRNDEDNRRQTQDVFDTLRRIGWIGPRTNLLHIPLTCAIQTYLHDFIRTIMADNYEQRFMPEIEAKITSQLQPWLSHVDPDWSGERLRIIVAESYTRVRMEEIFSLITCYPESEIAVEELREVLEVSKLQNELAEYLKTSLIRRINHPGANTLKIIDVYRDITSAKLFDPRLLKVVTEPVRSYLHNRHDTVRCIITSLTEGELYDELRRQDAKPLENVNFDSDDEDEKPTMDWQPAPSLKYPKVEGGLGQGDILAMLVSIYGSKELFVDEYRVLLAGRLLASMDYSTDKERHTLELLKLRFGETSLSSPEVMIKDIDDSLRANKNIHESIESVVDAVMVSHIFWPKLQDQQLIHHPRIQEILDEFALVYAAKKNPRKLRWLNQQGSVELQLEVWEDGRLETKDFTCSPLLATLLTHFEDRDTWTAEELANETSVPEYIIQKRMAFWISRGVVVQTESQRHAYRLAGQSEKSQVEHMILEDDGLNPESHAVSASAQQEEEMEVYESYIVVLLNGMQQASLEKIHNMLKVMVSSGSDTKYNKTKQQLKTFLQHLCRTERLECGPDGLYKLVKN